MYVSSSMVFERAELLPNARGLPAATAPCRVSAYGFSKLTGEVYCRAAHDEHGFPYTICRPFNAYGPGEMPDAEPGIAHAVPDLINKVLAGQRPLEIFGSGEQTRTLTHIDDIADGVVTAMSSPAGLNEDFNISASRELTVAEIARIIWEACGEDPEDFELKHLPTFAVDVQRRWPSVEKAKRLLGWEARSRSRRGSPPRSAWLRELSRQIGSRPNDRQALCTDHRRHRPGRLLPCRAAAREGLRRPRHGPPRLDGEVRADRAHPRPHHPAPGRPARPALAGGRDACLQTSGDLQPRGDVLRRGLLDPADPDGRVHRRRRHADARGDARSLPRGALLPGVLERDVRQGARGSPDRDDALLPALALRRGEGLRPLHHGQLPRVL